MSTNDEQKASADPEQSSAEADGGGFLGEPAEGKAADPVEEARAEVARIKDQLLRTLADFDNFRKRTRREIDDAQKRGREDLLREILPVFDNLERAAAHAGQAADAKAV